ACSTATRWGSRSAKPSLIFTIWRVKAPSSASPAATASTGLSRRSPAAGGSKRRTAPRAKADPPTAALRLFGFGAVLAGGDRRANVLAGHQHFRGERTDRRQCAKDR